MVTVLLGYRTCFALLLCLFVFNFDTVRLKALFFYREFCFSNREASVDNMVCRRVLDSVHSRLAIPLMDICEKHKHGNYFILRVFRRLICPQWYRHSDAGQMLACETLTMGNSWSEPCSCKPRYQQTSPPGGSLCCSGPERVQRHERRRIIKNDAILTHALTANVNRRAWRKPYLPLHSAALPRRAPALVLCSGN